MTSSFSVKIGNIYSTVKLCGEFEYVPETTLAQSVKDAFTAYMVDKAIIDESVDGVIEIEYNIVGYDEINDLVVNAKVGIYSDGNAKRGVIYIMSLKSIGTESSDIWSDANIYAYAPEDQETLLKYVEWARDIDKSLLEELNMNMIATLKRFSEWDEIII